MRLITIPLSHYCERARWALDACGVPYTEEKHLQGFHARAVKAEGGRRTLPILADIPGSGPLIDSGDIVRYADAHTTGLRLYPDDLKDEILAAELEYAKVLGVEARRVAYHWLLPHPRLLLPYNNAGAPWYQRITVSFAFPFLASRLRTYMKIHDDTVAEGERVLAALFDRTAESLRDGYRVGGRFTAADLTFASLAAPILLPEQYGVPILPVGELPAELRAKVEAWREHPAGQYALRIYRDHRR